MGRYHYARQPCHCSVGGIVTDLRASLERLGLSQAAFARCAGTTTVSVHRWLTGKRPIAEWIPSWLAMFEQLTPEQRKEIWP
jgi:transcriptional regulator with XRE-family HTH domain